MKVLFNQGDIRPETLTALRVGACFLLLLAVLAPRRGRRLMVRREDLPLVALMGVVGLAANSYGYYKTISLTNVATAVVLTYLAPVFLAIHAVLVLRRSPAPSTLVAIAFAVAGCFVLVKGYDPGALRLNLPGLGFGLLTAGAFAVFSVTSQSATRRYDAWTVLLYGYGVATGVWAFALPFLGFAPGTYRGRVWIALLVIAVVGSLLPFGLFVRGLAYLSPTQATVVSTTEPVIAAVVAYLVLGETMAPLQYVGALLVLVAVVLVQRPASR